MGIVNRRNAVLGWAAWQVGRRVAIRRAREARSARVADLKRRPSKGVIVSAVAAVAGALWFVRRRRGGGEGEKPPTPPADSAST